MNAATRIAIVASIVLTASALAAEPASVRLMAPIDDLIGDATCENHGECHVVGVGAKPCGGPGGYRAWSDRATDAKALRGAVAAQANAQADEDRAAGLLSDCRVVPVPAAVCRPRASDGRKTCQLVRGGVGSAI